MSDPSTPENGAIGFYLAGIWKLPRRVRLHLLHCDGIIHKCLMCAIIKRKIDESQ
jgi:hypothetical protein